MKMEKDTYTKEEVQKLLNWCFNMIEYQLERQEIYRNAEEQVFKYPWWRKLFTPNILLVGDLYRNLRPHLEKVDMNNSVEREEMVKLFTKLLNEDNNL